MTSPLPVINLRDQFLISMPHLADQNFVHTLTYICDHSDEGAMGLVINRPTELTVDELLRHLEYDPVGLADPKAPVYYGGPVQPERGFVLHRPTAREWGSSHAVSGELCLTTSLDILEAIALGDGPSECLVILGYAGWGAGQLEREIGENSWLSCPADLDIIFATQAEQRMGAAAAKLGIDLNLLSAQSGHA